jgi:catechol 2,3-dioxygenase-like lactoylglutathione lyase family enzyme
MAEDRVPVKILQQCVLGCFGDTTGRRHMLRIGSIVWGVRDVARAIDFWCNALGYLLLREPDETWAILVPDDGPGAQLAIKLVTSNPEDHQRHHLDVYTCDQAAEVERLLKLGATRVDWRYPEHGDYVVLADPDGNTFCVVQK